MINIATLELLATRAEWWPRALHVTLFPPSPAVIVMGLGALGLAALLMCLRWR